MKYHLVLRQMFDLIMLETSREGEVIFHSIATDRNNLLSREWNSPEAEKNFEYFRDQLVEAMLDDYRLEAAGLTKPDG